MSEFWGLALLVAVVAVVSRAMRSRPAGDEDATNRDAAAKEHRPGRRRAHVPPASGVQQWQHLTTKPEREAYVLAGLLESGGIPVLTSVVPQEWIGHGVADQLRRAVVVSVPATYLDDAREVVAELDATS